MKKCCRSWTPGLDSTYTSPFPSPTFKHWLMLQPINIHTSSDYGQSHLHQQSLRVSKAQLLQTEGRSKITSPIASHTCAFSPSSLQTALPAGKLPFISHIPYEQLNALSDTHRTPFHMLIYLPILLNTCWHINMPTASGVLLPVNKST